MTEKKRNQGNTPFIRYPTQGFLPYNSGHEILKSCDINFPLKLNLLCVRELARSFSKFIHAGKVDANSLISIPMIKYVVPQEPICSEVQNLIAEVQALNLGRRDDNLNLRQSIYHPLGNSGANIQFASGFKDVKFVLPKVKKGALGSKDKPL